MEHPTLAIMDLRRLDDGGVECVHCEYTMNDEIDVGIVMHFSPDELNELQCLLNQVEDEHFVVVNRLPDEFKAMFSKPLVDLSTYGCPCATEIEQYDEVSNVCSLHEKEKLKCALWHHNHMFNWLTKDCTVMRMVCASVKKYNHSGPASFNNLDWCFMPADVLILLAGRDLPRLWDILPEGFKKQHPEYEYCMEHYINNDSDCDQVDGPPSMKKNCCFCRAKRREEEGMN